MTNPFTAQWTAKGSNLCLGHWDIRYNGNPVVLPSARQQNDMGTYGIFSHIYPDDDCFAEGLSEDRWIEENSTWLEELFVKQGIPADEAHFRWFYRAVNPQDWRCGSCGGCL